ncbi:unnamed protein product [Amoebophrya sp. A120]|nr:unnamed protein product [Amoebophrya sp. A120]|eukprot:GSA120T00023005001.1
MLCFTSRHAAFVSSAATFFRAGFLLNAPKFSRASRGTGSSGTARQSQHTLNPVASAQAVADGVERRQTSTCATLQTRMRHPIVLPSSCLFSTSGWQRLEQAGSSSGAEDRREDSGATSNLPAACGVRTEVDAGLSSTQLSSRMLQQRHGIALVGRPPQLHSPRLSFLSGAPTSGGQHASVRGPGTCVARYWHDLKRWAMTYRCAASVVSIDRENEWNRDQHTARATDRLQEEESERPDDNRKISVGDSDVFLDEGKETTRHPYLSSSLRSDEVVLGGPAAAHDAVADDDFSRLMMHGATESEDLDHATPSLRGAEQEAASHCFLASKSSDGRLTVAGTTSAQTAKGSTTQDGEQQDQRCSGYTKDTAAISSCASRSSATSLAVATSPTDGKITSLNKRTSRSTSSAALVGTSVRHEQHLNMPLGMQWQRRYDEIMLASPESLPPFLRALTEKISVVRSQRERRIPDIRQHAVLAANRNAVMQARKVIYVAFPEDPRLGTQSDSLASTLFLQASRQPAATDLVAQLARARFSNVKSKNDFWLRVFGKGGGALTVLLLESLQSSGPHCFRHLHAERLEFWRRELESLCGSADVVAVATD